MKPGRLWSPRSRWGRLRRRLLHGAGKASSSRAVTVSEATVEAVTGWVVSLTYKQSHGVCSPCALTLTRHANNWLHGHRSPIITRNESHLFVLIISIPHAVERTDDHEVPSVNSTLLRSSAPVESVKMIVLLESNKKQKGLKGLMCVRPMWRSCVDHQGRWTRGRQSPLRNLYWRPTLPPSNVSEGYHFSPVCAYVCACVHACMCVCVISLNINNHIEHEIKCHVGLHPLIYKIK